MKNRYLLTGALSLAAATLATAQTPGGVRIGTAGTPNDKAILDLDASGKGLLIPRMDSLTRVGISAPPTGLMVFQTNGRVGFFYYGGGSWLYLPDKTKAGDNLGNHSATQTLNLNAQRLLGSVGTSLGDSTAQVELNASVGTQSTALITRSNFGARYSRVMLSGYGKLPDGTTTANDYGIWATAYRGGGWAGFFSAGRTNAPLRWVGICQNPGYNNTGSAIRIVDGTQAAGRVLTSDGVGYGTWQPITAAGGNFNLGTYYLVGNGGSTGIAITNAGRVGINVTAPFSQLANTATNIVGSEGAGGNPGSLAWAANQSGYAGMFYNAGTATNSTGLAVKIAGNGTAAALDVSQGATQDAAGTPLLRVLGNGNVGIGVSTPAVTLDISGGDNLTYSATYAYLNSGGAGSGYTATLNNVSVRATGRMVANEFNAASDQRLKTVIGPSNGAADLALLRQLRVTDYQMRDRVRFGERRFKKVIAQEVEAVYPQAVTQLPGFLPDVYAAASAAELLPGDSLLTLTLPTPLPTAATAGQRLRLIGPRGEVVAALASPAAAGSRCLTLRGARPLAGQAVFVFGLEHPDVRAVDYEALAMLNVSATQELARQVEELRQLNAALQRQNTALHHQSQTQTTRLDQQQAALSNQQTTLQTQATQAAELSQRLQTLENLLGARASAK